MLSVAVLVALLSAPAAQQVAAQGAVFLVRHAERADAGTPAASMMGADPDLSRKGRARAKSLAAMLRDAGIRAIYATEVKRTQQTAAPLADMLQLTVVTIPSSDVTSLVDKVRGETGNVLIVGHSNTIPKILAALGATDPIAIGENEYDTLFILVRETPARVLRLHH